MSAFESQKLLPLLVLYEYNLLPGPLERANDKGHKNNLPICRHFPLPAFVVLDEETGLS